MKRRNFLALFLVTVFMLAALFDANAYDFEVDGIYYGLNTNDMTAYVTNGGSTNYQNSDTYTGDITIPETVTYNNKTLVVTAIGEYAFTHCKNLINVTLPSSIKEIGEKAFYGSGIVSIDIPEGVEGIPQYAFESCRYLKKVVLPNSVNIIGKSAFGSSSVEEINFPEGLKIIENEAFADCDSLKEIILPNSLTSLGEKAFAGCFSLKKVVLGYGLTELLHRTLSNCSSLSSLRIPANITSMDCDFLLNSVMDSLIFDDGHETILFRPGTFYNSREAAVEYVYLGRNIDDIQIGCYPFILDRVKEVSFGSNYSDKKNLFTQTSNLQKISSHNSSPSPIDEFPAWVYANLPLRVPIGTKVVYENTSGWNKFFNIIEDPSLGAGSGGDMKICEAPTIHYSNKKLYIQSNTDCAKCCTTITCADVKESTNNEISLDAIYDISSYAYAEGYLNSETVTARLYWISATPNPQMMNFIKCDVNSDGEVNIADVNVVIYQIQTGQAGHQLSSVSDVRGILIQRVSNSVIISGLYENEEIALCDEFGKKLHSTKAVSGVARFNVNSEDNTIIIGDKLIKVLL